jgi:hypothetical protein
LYPHIEGMDGSRHAKVFYHYTPKKEEEKTDSTEDENTNYDLNLEF